jgi:hypothetical protein
MPFPVAVVVPTYNRADLLPATLDRILGQTLPPAEVVVIDDGGADNTADVLKKYGERVKYRVKLTSAEWIALCDDDDLWTPNYLERMAAAHARFPEAEFLFSDFTFVKDGTWTGESKFATAPAGYWDGDVTRDGTFTLLRDSMYARSVRFQPVFVSCMVFRRTLFDRLGGYDSQFSRIGAEDWEFTLRAIGTPPVVALNEPLVGIRKHAGSVSSGLLKVLEGEVQILKHALAHHPAAAAHRPLLEVEIGTRTRAAAEVAFDTERFDRARALLKQVPAGLNSGKLKLKGLIAGLPGWLAKPLKRVVSR